MGETIYKGFDQEALDDQLDNRKRVPEHQDFFDRWAGGSAAARRDLDCALDLAYGASAGETLDLFPVPGESSAPLLAFIHGGYWQFLDKGDFSFLAPPFVEAGIAFASLNYDLAPAVGIPEITRQIRAALAWLAREGAAHGIDPGRLYVAGHSAGGHLAAMAALDGWAAGQGLNAHPIKAACSVSGLYELEPIRLSYQQEALKLDPAQVAEQSPGRLSPAGAAPMICAVGAEESQEFLDQQAELVVAWTAAGASVAQVPLPGRNHFSAVEALGEPDHALFGAVKGTILG